MSVVTSEGRDLGEVDINLQEAGLPETAHEQLLLALAALPEISEKLAGGVHINRDGWLKCRIDTKKLRGAKRTEALTTIHGLIVSEIEVLAGKPSRKDEVSVT